MKITTYDVKKGKTVLAGELENKVFTKKVTSKHFMRKFQAYGIQEDVIQQLWEKGCDKIVIQTSTVVWESPMHVWLQPNIKVMDFGHGKQRFLTLSYMKRIA
jgi:hypothetical protein